MCTTENTCNEGSVWSGDACNKNKVFCHATDYVAAITQGEGSGNGQIVAHLEIELAYDRIATLPARMFVILSLGPLRLDFNSWVLSWSQLMLRLPMKLAHSAAKVKCWLRMFSL